MIVSLQHVIGRAGLRMAAALTAAASAIAVAIGVAIGSGTPLYEVKRTGAFLEHSDVLAREVEILGVLTIYTEKTGLFPGDVVPALLFAVLASVAASVSGFLVMLGSPRRLVALFALTACGAGWLAFDELAGVHEAVAHTAAKGLGIEPPFGRGDEWVIGFYGLVAATGAWRLRSELLAIRPALLIAACGAATACAALLADLTKRGPENALETLNATTLTVAFVVFGHGHIQRQLQARAQAASGSPPGTTTPAS